MKVYKDIVIGLPFACPPRVLRTENGRWYLQFSDSNGRAIEASELPPTYFESWDSARWSANARNNALHTAEMQRREEGRIKPDVR